MKLFFFIFIALMGLDKNRGLIINQCEAEILNKNSKTKKPSTNKNQQELAQSTLNRVDIKESTVEIQGKKFRKMELETETIFVETLDSTEANEEIRVLCQEGRQEIPSAQVVAGAKLTKHTSIVVEGLKQVCKDVGGNRKSISVDPSILVGLQINPDKSKSKKIIVSPFGINFVADW